MYSFENLRPTSKKELYELIDSYDIFRHFFGEFEESKKYISPLRIENDASFQIDQYEGEWVYRDFGKRNEPRSAVQFVMELEDLNYRDAVELIYEKLKDTSKAPDTVPEKKERVKPASVRYSKKLTKYEIDYFSLGGITHETLLHFKTYSCKELWYDGNILAMTSPTKPLVVYMFANNIWKSYGPYHDKAKKFFSWNVNNHIQGYDLLPDNGHVLFITKSYKDVMVLYELGFPAIAPHSEGANIDPWLVDELQSRFRYIYVFFDNDKTGIETSTLITDIYKLYYCNVPHNLNTITKPTKDPFDVVKNYNMDILKGIIHMRFQKDEIDP